MKKLTIIFFIIFALSISLFAGQSDEIKKLETRIEELEKRVEKLESLMDDSTQNNINYTEKWKNRSLWRKLKVGMSKYQVESILGEPRKIDGGSILTYWYYSEDTWHCKISFDDNDRVYGWTEPD